MSRPEGSPNFGAPFNSSAPAGREMLPAEIAIEAVIVGKQNPLEGMTGQQVLEAGQRVLMHQGTPRAEDLEGAIVAASASKDGPVMPPLQISGDSGPLDIEVKQKPLPSVSKTRSQDNILRGGVIIKRRSRRDMPIRG